MTIESPNSKNNFTKTINAFFHDNVFNNAEDVHFSQFRDVYEENEKDDDDSSTHDTFFMDYEGELELGLEQNDITTSSNIQDTSEEEQEYEDKEMTVNTRTNTETTNHKLTNDTNLKKILIRKSS
jgi:hypothetical protein